MAQYQLKDTGILHGTVQFIIYTNI